MKLVRYSMSNVAGSLPLSGRVQQGSRGCEEGEDKAFRPGAAGSVRPL